MIHSSLVTHRRDLSCHVGEEKQKGLTVVQDPASLEGLSPLTASHAREGGNENCPGTGKDVSDLTVASRGRISSVLSLAVRRGIWICSCGRNEPCPWAFIFLDGENW